MRRATLPIYLRGSGDQFLGGGFFARFMRTRRMMGQSAPRHRKAAVAVAIIVILVIINLAVVGIVISGSRDHDLTVKRLETIGAFYAAEAGMNMAIREVREEIDEDLDGLIGTVSNDSDDGTDPTFGNAAVVVTAAIDVPAAGQATLTSQGRSGDARRQMQGVVD